MRREGGGGLAILSLWLPRLSQLSQEGWRARLRTYEARREKQGPVTFGRNVNAAKEKDSHAHCGPWTLSICSAPPHGHGGNSPHPVATAAPGATAAKGRPRLNARGLSSHVGSASSSGVDPDVAGKPPF